MTLIPNIIVRCSDQCLTRDNGHHLKNGLKSIPYFKVCYSDPAGILDDTWWIEPWPVRTETRIFRLSRFPPFWDGPTRTLIIDKTFGRFYLGNIGRLKKETIKKFLQNIFCGFHSSWEKITFYFDKTCCLTIFFYWDLLKLRLSLTPFRNTARIWIQSPFEYQTSLVFKW